MTQVPISPLRVTFDTNAWQRVTLPDKFRRDSAHSNFLKINAALSSGRLLGFICDTVATLEGLQNKQRPEFLAKQRVEAKLVNVDGLQDPVTMVAPDQSHRPALSPVLTDRLKDAVALGLKLMRTPRYTELTLPTAYYASGPSSFLDSFGKVSHAIESHGVGRAVLTKFARELAMRHLGSAMYFDIPDVPLTPDDERSIRKAVAEWADGDSVACHFSFGNDYFCTEDKGNSAGTSSVLDKPNREWLTKDFAVRFLSISELAALV
jgi:hypothetical protein